MNAVAQPGPLGAFEVAGVAGHHQHPVGRHVEDTRERGVHARVGLVGTGQLGGQDAVERQAGCLGQPGQQADAAVGQRGEDVPLAQRGEAGNGVRPRASAGARRGRAQPARHRPVPRSWCSARTSSSISACRTSSVWNGRSLREHPRQRRLIPRPPGVSDRRPVGVQPGPAADLRERGGDADRQSTRVPKTSKATISISMTGTLAEGRPSG